ncbi:MAG: AAA family ATPase [Elusimicrobia bacterium RIFCSPLOWO2_01_FULL_64_13]|nr:MAG: AAA family ATPase [Elusimicrobia bacterium RIFCSPLOWO2_01_FULL_64_13]
MFSVEAAQSEKDMALAGKLVEAHRSINEQLCKVIVGQREVIDELLISLFARGHCLIVGVPGLAKTLLISSLAEILDLDFKRIQFTPDLMPSDITGTEVIQEDKTSRERSYRFLQGPVFANLLLADEINRTPPKTQAALLQSMQEYHVTVGGRSYPLPLPFFVLATQNPIEQEGTYPLPEAQLDRFFFQVNIDYPSFEEEKTIVHQSTSARGVKLKKVLNAGEVLALQDIVRRVPVSDHVVDYAVRLAAATRPKNPGAPDFARKWISWGAGPRASQSLILGGKARAVLDGRFTVSIDDVRALAAPVLRHRLVLSFNAEAEDVRVERVIFQLLETVPQ